MGAIKEHHHDLIEKQSRLYSVTELHNMEKPRLLEIAGKMNVTVGDSEGKQTLIYAILNQQSAEENRGSDPIAIHSQPEPPTTNNQ